MAGMVKLTANKDIPLIMAENLQKLKVQMRDCRLCTDLELGPRPIFQLDPAAKILIAGHAPGRVTHAKDRPFDDASGVRLRSWMGVGASTFYDDKRIAIFPMGLCFPGSGTSGDNPPRPICAQTWRARVMAALVDVELILVLGRYAIAWHLPEFKKRPIRDVVRRTIDGSSKAIALPHPSPRNNRWLKQNDWFADQAIPQIQSRVVELLAR